MAAIISIWGYVQNWIYGYGRVFVDERNLSYRRFIYLPLVVFFTPKKLLKFENLITCYNHLSEIFDIRELTMSCVKVAWGFIQQIIEISKTYNLNNIYKNIKL